ncbi:glucosidase [Cytophagaceae bacterium ABcell3]|nr:glucosidase [Cytophagaceae bacterium ABcell3]
MALQEVKRLKDCKENNPWKIWGPYLTERQWGTVREDYSSNSSAWDFITHDMARSKAYRWGEEGIAGISDHKSLVCFAVALWNGKDPILKERLFGLAGPEGNHGEDVKEIYYYLDSSPTHSYMKMLYRYPQAEFPYAALKNVNRHRSKKEMEYEIYDTGVFNKNRFFDVHTEYAKADPHDILIKITVKNQGPDTSELTVLPTLWLRNIWSLGYECGVSRMKANSAQSIHVEHHLAGDYYFYTDRKTDLLFCNNETNYKRLFGVQNKCKYCKDGINDYIVSGQKKAVNPEKEGTKASATYKFKLKPGQEEVVCLRLSSKPHEEPFADFDQIFEERVKETDEFYEDLQKDIYDDELKMIQRQAFAGMMWSKQYYYFNIQQWLNGDPGQMKPPRERLKGRNANWSHLNNSNIISMPDKWEYPWYASWDLAFHCIPLAHLDPDFAKRQLTILLREYYLHPNGQIPAYEWNFNDVNPPVHAWATWRVYEIDKEKNKGKGDIDFLERVFHKLLMNFTWWVNQKDTTGNNIFEGGFLGLDNIGVFDRSHGLPHGGKMEQADATSWMGMYCLNMLRISCELALERPSYQDAASKFFEHFLFIAGAMNNIGGEGISLWDEDEEFYFDVLHLPNGKSMPLKIHSMVGLIPLYAVQTINPEMLEKLPDFKRRLEWVIENRPDLSRLISSWYEHGKGETRLLSLVNETRLRKVLTRMLDEDEFLSDFGIRALSKYHKKHPYQFHINGEVLSVSYLPSESDSTLFGGNSNWRGPVWFPVNFMIIEALKEYYRFYGNDFLIEFPTGSGKKLNLEEVAFAISRRLINIFCKDAKGKRPVFGGNALMQTNPLFNDHVLFYEYFHGDIGAGIGASHQTGWTGLVADLISDCCNNREVWEDAPSEQIELE